MEYSDILSVLFAGYMSLRDPVDRTSLLVQLGQYPARCGTGRGHKEETDTGIDPPRPLTSSDLRPSGLFVAGLIAPHARVLPGGSCSSRGRKAGG